jgi:sugar/nucleoside kinase (ribokinase family)
VPAHLTGERDMEAALRKLRKTHDNVLVVTMGEHGAMALDGDRFYHEPAFTVHAVDTTGAGDVFRGGFIYALLDGQPIDRALRTANAAAAVSCTRLGALNGVPTLDEVHELVASGKVKA